MATNKNREHCFKFWPNEGKTIIRMFDRGFFLKNPEPDSPDAYVCYYFEADQAKAYIEKHPDAKIWTIIEEEGKEYIVERVQFVNRLHYLIENPSVTPGHRAYLLSRKGLRRYRG